MAKITRQEQAASYAFKREMIGRIQEDLAAREKALTTGRNRLAFWRALEGEPLATIVSAIKTPEQKLADAIEEQDYITECEDIWIKGERSLIPKGKKAAA